MSEGYGGTVDMLPSNTLSGGECLVLTLSLLSGRERIVVTLSIPVLHYVSGVRITFPKNVMAHVFR